MDHDHGGCGVSPGWALGGRWNNHPAGEKRCRLARLSDRQERAFGETLARHLGQTQAPTALTHTAHKQMLAVTSVRTDGSRVYETEPFAPQDAFHVILQRTNLPSHELFSNGRLINTDPYPRDSVSIIDLRTRATTRIASAHEALVFYVPREAINEITSDYGTPPVDGLNLAPGVARLDPVLARLGAFLLPLLREPPGVSSLCADELMLLVQAHLAQSYGSVRTVRQGMRGGLAPGEERRAKELMSASLDRPLSLAELASACSLSVSHFTRAFRQSTGMPPHRWLVERRIEAAKAMLLAGELPTAQIAQACGFAEQSSFTKTFARVEGVTPAAWRRLHKS